MRLLRNLRERAKSGFHVRALDYDVSIRLSKVPNEKRTAIGKVVTKDIAASQAHLNGFRLPLDPAQLGTHDRLVLLELYRARIGMSEEAAREVTLREALFTGLWAADSDALRSEIAEQIALSFERSGSPECAMEVIQHGPSSPRLQALASRIDRELDLIANAFPDHTPKPSGRMVAGRHAFLRDLVDSEPELFRSRAVLHIAPERELRAMLTRNAARLNMRYTTLDAFSPSAEIKDDLRALDLPDAGFDTILCHHVLEHVLDEMAALRELRRVLRPEGVLHVSVPQNGLLARTVEWAIPDVNATRHVRMYGTDFVDRLEAAGFACARHVYVEPCHLKPHRAWRRPYYVCRPV